MQLRRDFAENRRRVFAFLAFWAALLVVTAFTWQRGMRAPVFLIHLLVLPFLAGLATAAFKANSGLAGLAVSLFDLLVLSVVPWASLSLLPPPPTPKEVRVFTGWAAVLEVLGFAILMGIPGYLMGLLGGALGALRRRRGGSATW